MLFSIGILLHGGLNIFAQKPSLPDYDIRRISMQDGLANHVITAVCEDKTGRLWLGTQNGLYTFDGFQIARFGAGGTEKLPNEFISGVELLETQNGNYLLICTKNGGLVLDATRNSISTTPAVGIPDSLMRKLSLLKKRSPGHVIGLAGTTLFQIQQQTNGHYKYQHLAQVPDADYLSLEILPNAPDDIWLLPAAKTAVRISRGKVHHCILPIIPGNRTQTSGLLGLVQTPTGLIGWDYIRNLYRYKPGSEKFEPVLSGLSLVDLFPGLPLLDHRLNQPTILLGYHLLETNQELIRTTLGLFVLRKKDNQFQIVEPLIGTEIRGIHTDSAGHWWVGTYSGFTSGSIYSNKTRVDSAAFSVWAYLQLTDSLWMIGQETPEGLLLWDKKTGIVSPTDNDLVSVLALCRDQQGVYWAGNYTGLYRAPPDSPTTFRPVLDPTTKRPFSLSFARALLPYRDSTLWVGTEKGLFRFYPYHPPEQNRIDTLLPGLLISDFYHDRYDNIWIATKPNGIARYNPKSKDFSWFDINHGHTSNATCRIEGSNDDQVLWISTHDGLSRLDVQSGTFHNYHEDDGLPGNEFNSAASARSPDGTLFFGGINGLVHFHPDSLNPGNFRYKTILSQAYLHRTDTILPLSLADSRLDIPPYPHVLEICLGINDFIRSHKAQFRYRLTEISDSWSYVRGENKIRFFQLPPGDYILEIQAIALDGHLAPSVFINIHVNAPYYETWWFRTVFLALIILLSYLAYLYRLKQALREYTIRQQIADDLHDDIGNKLNIVHILVQKIINMQRENHQIFPEETFKKLIATNRETLQSLRTLIWSVDPKKDRLANLLNRMQDFADDYLLPLNIHCHFDLPKIASEKEIKPDVRHHVILIFQELLTNMVKHTSPKEIYVRATVESDNGLEFTIENICHATSQKHVDSTSGNQGKFSLERRLEKIGGIIRLFESSQNPQKTVIFFPEIFK